MATNLELKINIESIDKYEETLKSFGAEYINVLNQRDVYFENKKGLLKLRVMDDGCELIHYLRDEKATDRFSNYELLKMDKSNAEKFLTNILEQEVIVSKRRKLYMYDNSRIHLDNVDDLGEYLEIETLVIDDNHEDAKIRFSKLKELLQITDVNPINTSYRFLMDKK